MSANVFSATTLVFIIINTVNCLPIPENKGGINHCQISPKHPVYPKIGLQSIVLKKAKITCIVNGVIDAPIVTVNISFSRYSKTGRHGAMLKL